MHIIINILLYIWQLPQNLLGLILRAIYRQKNSLLYKDKIIRVCESFPGGISLGNTLIISKFPYNKPTWNIVKHEWGHTRQSLYLGPLYLIIIGIPSGLWALIHKYNPEKPNEYYTFFTEKWADKLGNVKR